MHNLYTAAVRRNVYCTVSAAKHPKPILFRLEMPSIKSLSYRSAMVFSDSPIRPSTTSGLQESVSTVDRIGCPDLSTRFGATSDSDIVGDCPDISRQTRACVREFGLEPSLVFSHVRFSVRNF
jgi:hypothetical protein